LKPKSINLKEKTEPRALCAAFLLQVFTLVNEQPTTKIGRFGRHAC